MLKYIYVDNENVTMEDVFPTMKCADKYDLPLLADICFEFVMRDLMSRNGKEADPARYLVHLENALAWAVGLDSVVENCLHYVDVHCKEVLKSERFTELQPSTLRTLLERDTFLAEEALIYAAVDRFAVAACTRDNLEPSPANRREVLGDQFYLIRFPLLTKKQISGLSAEGGMLDASTLKEIREDKQRFPMHPRRPPVIRVRDLEFQHQEKIFYNDYSLFFPALVMGTRGSGFLCLHLRDTSDDDEDHNVDDDEGETLMTVNPDQEEIVRAADYLYSGQSVFYDHREGTYIRAEHGCHLIALAGGYMKRRVGFNQIYLGHPEVMAWKKTRKNGTGKTDSVPKRRRSPDVAGSN
ncbi:BTB/POZ domain-containing protein 6-B-like [Paramacrobiotus metropolitanus]|uniref:BTB/POZ domain-containing protein 6-B-like n=1 Tax=Paramacrobiotus metropolitanus TaxID=2943436 RepID=UPI002445AC1B|nr:BTB/POZ domain-containing protein 6-B-like [Paramacrobiotus metropolitanus]